MDTTYFMKMSHAQAAMKAADEIYALRQCIAAMTDEVDHHKRWVSVMTEESYALKHKCEQLRQRVQELTAERDELLLYKNLANEYGLSVFEDMAALKQQRDELVAALEAAVMWADEGMTMTDEDLRKSRSAIASVKEK